MKNTENNYLVSKNYNLLHDLIVELKLMIVCFVNYQTNRFNPENNFIDRDIAIVSLNGNRYQIGVRGTGYEDYIEAPNKSKFYDMCKNLNLTFIEPTRIALSLDSCSSCENISDVECECIKNER